MYLPLRHFRIVIPLGITLILRSFLSVRYLRYSSSYSFWSNLHWADCLDFPRDDALGLRVLHLRFLANLAKLRKSLMLRSSRSPSEYSTLLVFPSSNKVFLMRCSCWHTVVTATKKLTSRGSDLYHFAFKPTSFEQFLECNQYHRTWFWADT